MLHSASGGDGGKVTIVVAEAPGDPGLVRVEVTDDGAPSRPTPRPAGEGDENGYGLRLVDILADRWGCDGDRAGTTTWFEIAS